jgi:uncharacterized protein (UPF0332 family)
MIDTSIRDLSAHRLEKAKDVLKQAQVLLNIASYDGSINRSYYAIFNAIRALLFHYPLSHNYLNILLLKHQNSVFDNLCDSAHTNMVRDIFI